jgi:hypothetical protein
LKDQPTLSGNIIGMRFLNQQLLFGVLHIFYRRPLKEINRWIRHYDAIRTNPDGVPNQNEGWISSKYPIEGMHWSEIADIFLPELGIKWGAACSSLKKSWWSYKMSKKYGSGLDSRRDLAYRINKIQYSMGIPLTQFEELEGLNLAESEFESEEQLSLDGEEWTREEIELRKEEKSDEDDWWIS